MSALYLMLPSFLLLLQQLQEIGALSIAVRHVDAAPQEHARHLVTHAVVPQEHAARQAYGRVEHPMMTGTVLVAGRLDVVIVPPQEHAMLEATVEKEDMDMRVILLTTVEMDVHVILVATGEM